MRYNWLVRKLIIPPYVCRKSMPNTTGKRIFLVTKSCTWNVLSSIARDSEVTRSAIRSLSSVLETKNRIGCSGGTQNYDQYNCSSNRLIEKPVSIKIVIGLWSKVPETTHCGSFEAGFWVTLLQLLLWPGILDLLVCYLLLVCSADENGGCREGLV